MNAVVSRPQSFGAISSKFATQQVDNELAAGVETGYPILGYRGKVWSIRYRGAATELMRPDGDGPMNSVEVVILKSSTHKSKIWYENGWVEGSNAAPDCFSANGVVPDASSTKKQSSVCATCPRNVWGSGRDGKGKACQDSKRLAITPLGDIENAAYGGPMLLRVPAASLDGLAQYGNLMQREGYPYYAIGTRIAFDQKESYPKFVFTGIRPLNDDEADKVIKLREDPQVVRIVAELESEQAPVQDQAPKAQVFEQYTAPQASAPAPQTTAAAPVQPSPQVTAAAPVATSGFGTGGGAAQVQASPAQPVKAETPVTASPAVQPAQLAQSQVDFDAAIDAKLDALLPKYGSK
ncbi:hypothetical protein [Pseudolabrys sp.]|uniref:hypothetical protein n=1 Tax=Pseudolabrys sp. TaxID=1960880 RepID=UPI003D138632